MASVKVSGIDLEGLMSGSTFNQFPIGIMYAQARREFLENPGAELVGYSEP